MKFRKPFISLRKLGPWVAHGLRARFCVDRGETIRRFPSIRDFWDGSAPRLRVDLGNEVLSSN